jgi:hypothetical protein
VVPASSDLRSGCFRLGLKGPLWRRQRIACQRNNPYPHWLTEKPLCARPCMLKRAAISVCWSDCGPIRRGQFILTRQEPALQDAPHSKPYDPGECSEYNPDQRVLSGRR